MKKIKAIAYCRASTNIEKQRNSIAKQLSSIQSFCENHGYELKDRTYSEYASAYSGKKRWQWEAAIREMRENKDLYLIVHKPARAFRLMAELEELHGLDDSLIERIRFVSTGNHSLPKFQIQLYVMLAEKESAELSDRIRKGIKHSKDKAAILGVEWKSGGNPAGIDRRIQERGANNNKRAKEEFLDSLRYRFRTDYFNKWYSQAKNREDMTGERSLILAHFLNEHGVSTRQRKPYTKSAAYNLLNQMFPGQSHEFGEKFIFVK